MSGIDDAAMALPPPREGSFRLLAAALVALGAIAALAPKGIAVAMPALAVLATWNARPALSALARTVLPALPLVAVAAVSAAWSITPLASAGRAGLLVLEAVFAALLAQSLPRRALPFLAGGVALGAALILAELLAGGPLTRALRGMADESVAAALSNGTTLVVLLAPAAAAALWSAGRRAAASGLLLLVAAAALTGRQLAAQLGLAALLAGGAVAIFWPGFIRALASAACAAVLAIPLLLPLPMALACRAASVKLSVTHRIHIWNFAEAMRQQRPWLGWGLETTRAIPGGRTHADLWTPCGLPVPPAEHLPSTELLPLHTHNAGIQLWLELGPAGVLAACLLLLVLAWRARADDAAGRAAQAASCAAAVVIALASYGAWQGWWVATLALAVASTAALNPASGPHPPPPSAR